MLVCACWREVCVCTCALIDGGTEIEVCSSAVKENKLWVRDRRPRNLTRW